MDWFDSLRWPTDFGWNLATIQAGGTLGVFGSLFLAWRAIVHGREDSSLRVRPWVGVTGFDYKAPSGTGLFVEETISVHYQNIGNLPARSLTIELTAQPIVPPGDDSTSSDDPQKFDTLTFGAVFPGEDSVQHFRLVGVQSGRLAAWLRAYDVRLTGEVSYGFTGKESYVTTFEAVIPLGADEDAHISWANQSAS